MNNKNRSECSIYFGGWKNIAHFPEALETAQKINKSRSKYAKTPHMQTWRINFRYENGELVAYLCVQSVGAVGLVGRYETKMKMLPKEVMKNHRHSLNALKKRALKTHCGECGKKLDAPQK